MKTKFIILGCGSSLGVPRIDGFWGNCNRNNKKNLRSRVSKIPQKRLASPNEIAQYIFYLASEKNTFISNQVISISGGE